MRHSLFRVVVLVFLALPPSTWANDGTDEALVVGYVDFPPFTYTDERGKAVGYLLTLGFLLFFVLLALSGVSQPTLLAVFFAWFLFNGIFAFGAAKLVVEETAAIYADADRVLQVFENLFRNAVVHGGETVTVRVGCTPDGLYVADDGAGMTAEVKDHLFETGYTTRDEGRGYGLAIVERICEAHGWTVHVSESDAGGARFDIGNVDCPR